MAGKNSTGGPLAGQTATLFFVAAGLMAIVAGLFAAEVFLNREVETLLAMGGPAAFGVAFLGLLGLYPTLVHGAPRLARGARICLGIGLLGAVILIVGAAGELAGLYAEAPAWVEAANLLLLVGIIFGFGTAAGAVLRTGTPSRTVGLLLLWPPVVFGGLIFVLGVIILGGSFPHWVHVGHSGSEALVYLGIGYLIRTGERPTDSVQSTPKSAA